MLPPLPASQVDVVLDASASGVNTVEREGISIVHPAKFIMIGSGNPAVRPPARQLLHGAHAPAAALPRPPPHTRAAC